MRRPCAPRLRSDGARGNTRISLAKLCAAARYTAWRTVTRSETATLRVAELASAPAGEADRTSTSSSARFVDPVSPSRPARVTRTSTRPPGRTSFGGPDATRSATRLLVVAHAPRAVPDRLDDDQPRL